MCTFTGVEFRVAARRWDGACVIWLLAGFDDFSMGVYRIWMREKETGLLQDRRGCSNDSEFIDWRYQSLDKAYFGKLEVGTWNINTKLMTTR